MHRLSFLATLLFLAIPGVTLAHPGHGSTEPSSITHFVLEPVHAVPLVVLGVLTVGMALFVRRRRVAKAPVKRLRDIAASTHE